VINTAREALKKCAKSVIVPWQARKFHNDIKCYEGPHKLHLGCGYHHLDGWINIDFIQSPAVDVIWNLGNPIPLDEASCSHVFHEHVLEHFELQRGVDLLSECYRILQPGGVLRVSMPSLESVIAAYQDGTWKDESRRSDHMPQVRTGAEYMNVLFRHWGHQWIYDATELSRVLNEVGFTELNQCEINQSDHSAMTGIEHRVDSHLIIEAIK